MPSFIPKKYPGKFGQSPQQYVLGGSSLTQEFTAEPMLPFMAAGAIVLYAINAGANAMMKCE